MLLRIVQFVVGVALGAGGGYLVWSNLDAPGSLVPPGPAGLPVLLLLGVLGAVAGLVLLVSAIHPRPNLRRLREAKAAREDAALQQAEAYYTERSRAVDRDWRSADITPPAPEPAKPVAAAAPQFPSEAGLAPIPRASEPPPTVARPAAPAAPVTPSGGGQHAAIRAAISAGQLDEAERLLNAARETAAGLDLAQLTALAGDHALAKGQQSHARWLWRLALKRFGENEATDSPAAHAVAESLRAAT